VTKEKLESDPAMRKLVGVPGVIRTHLDHRIAMAFAVAALRAEDEITILDCDHVATSFPGFDALARGLGLQISTRAGGEDGEGA